MPVQSLSKFIRHHKNRIVDEWLREAAALPSAHALHVDAVRDHIPEFLDHLAESIERGDLTAVTMQAIPNLHAATRVREGYDLRQVMSEYRLLRSVILRVYSEEGDISTESRPKLTPLSTMNAALDIAIADAVDQFAVDQGHARDMFIGMLGHDLRDPLNAIAFASQSMLDRGDALDAATAMTFAARISSNARRMDDMIRDLLDFARGRLGGGFPIATAPFDARSAIAETVRDIAHAHPERAIVCLATAAAGDFHVEWDRDRMIQAVANLVSNAVAHGTDPIVVEPHDRGETIAIDVKNTGEIAPTVLRTIFAPFTTPSVDRRHDAGGGTRAERRRGHLGLGLYIVREIATAHGGDVSARSEHGETIFTLTLPRSARTTPR